MIDRLAEEGKHLGAEIKRLVAAGIKFPSTDAPESYEYSYKGETKSMSFPKFEARVHMPVAQIKGDYPKLQKTVAALVDAYQAKKHYSRFKTALSFNCRAAEYAHYKAQDRLPAWIKNTAWEDGFKLPGGKIVWQRLKLFQPVVGQHAVSILKRETTKAKQVNIDY